MLNDLVSANGVHHGVLSPFESSPGEGALVKGVEPPGPAAVPCGGAFLMTFDASGISLSATGPPGGGAFSMTLNAGGKGPSDAAGPPGAVAFSWALKASGSADCAGAEPGVCDAVPRCAGWGTTLGGRRRLAAGGVETEGLVLTAGAGRAVAVGGVATLGGRAPGLAGWDPAGFPSPITITPATLFLLSNMRL